MTLAEAATHFRGKRVAIVGGGPSVLNNAPGWIDSFDIVVRMNNYRTGPAQGFRCDAFYSYFGNCIHKTVDELKRDGVKLCMVKVPNAKPIESAWHERLGKQHGIDFRWIFALRKDFWFCPTYVPTVERFVEQFNLLEKHIPTTGFSAILDVLACEPACCYLTGYDMFSSRLHNVNEPWRPGDPSDPIGHRPDLEARWLGANAKRYLLMLDPVVAQVIAENRAAA